MFQPQSMDIWGLQTISKDSLKGIGEKQANYQET